MLVHLYCNIQLSDKNARINFKNKLTLLSVA